MTPLEILESLTNVEHLATAAGPETGSAALMQRRSGPGEGSFGCFPSNVGFAPEDEHGNLRKSVSKPSFSGFILIFWGCKISTMGNPVEYPGEHVVA